MRNARLDHLCEEVGDCRERMNQDRGIEQSAIRDALTEMQRTGVQAYKHAGVEFARIPGGEKLRVRLTKDQGHADEGDFAPADGSVDPDGGHSEPPF